MGPRNGPSPKSSPSKSAESTSVFEVYNSRRSGEKYVEFDEDEKASYAPLTPEKKNFRRITFAIHEEAFLGQDQGRLGKGRRKRGGGGCWLHSALGGGRSRRGRGRGGRG